MKYNCKNYIRVFYEASEIGGRSKEKMIPSSPSLEISSEEKKRMDEFSEKLISAIVGSSDKKQALKTFSIWETALIEKFNGTLPKHWKSLIETVRGYITISPKLFERSTGKIITNKEVVATWTKEVKGAIKGDTKVISSNTERTVAIEPQSEVKVLPPSAEDANSNINTDMRKVLSEKERQESIDKFASDLASEAIAHPWEMINTIKEKRGEILKFKDSPDYTKYKAIVDTVEAAVNDGTFQDETGIVQSGIASFKHGASKLFRGTAGRTKMERSHFERTFRELVSIAGRTGEAQSINDNFQKDMYKGLSIDEVKAVNETSSPNKLFDNYIKGLAGVTDKSVLLNYTQGMRLQVSDILKKLDPKNPIVKEYNSVFGQMDVITNLAIETESTWSQFTNIFKGRNTSIEKLISASKEMLESKKVGVNGGIGFAGGDFEFYTADEMEDAIMKGGENIEGKTDAAWENYIKSLKGDFKELESVFSKGGISALALYLDKLNYSSKIIDNNDGFKEYIKTKLPDKNADTYKIKTPEKGRTIEDLKNINKENYPTFIEILKDNQLDGIDKVTSDDSGYINILTIVGQIMDKNEGKVTPEIFQQLLDGLGKDNAKIREGANEAIKSTTEQLEEKTIQDLLKSVGIPDRVQFENKETKENRMVLFHGDINCSTISDMDKLKILIEEVQKKKTELDANPQENKEKISKIQVFLTILENRRIAIAATNAGTQSKKEGGNPTASFKAMSDPNVRKSYTDLSQERARQTVSSSSPDIPVSEKLLTDYKLPPDWREGRNISIERLLEIQKLLVKGGLTSDDEKDLHEAIEENITKRRLTAKVVIDFNTFKEEHGNAHSGVVTWYQGDNHIYSDENINSNLEYYKSSITQIDAYNSQFSQATRVTKTPGTGGQIDTVNSTQSRNTYTLADISQSTGGPSYYAASQIQELTSLGLSNETLSSTNISEISKGVYQIVTVDDVGKKYEINDVKKGELEKKMTDIDILGSMNAQILIPYMKIIQIFAPYNPQIRDIVAKDDKEKKRIQLISTIALLLGEDLPGTAGDREQDIVKLQQKYTNSSSIFDRLRSTDRGANQVFDDGGSIIMSAFERVLRGKNPRIQDMNNSAILELNKGMINTQTLEKIKDPVILASLAEQTRLSLEELKSGISRVDNQLVYAEGASLNGRLENTTTYA